MSKAPEGFELPTYTKSDVYAFQALAQGNASEGQQKRALMWIFDQATKVDDLSFRPGPGGDRATVFAEGRRFVGLQIAKLMNLKSTVVENLKDG